MNLSPKHLSTLRAVCDAFVPALHAEADPHGFYALRASDFQTAEKIAIALDHLSPQQQQDFLRLLDILSSPVLGLTWLGAWKSVQNLTPEEAETMLQRWSKSPLPPLRQGFHALKKLTTFLLYGYSDDNTQNPTWAAIKYPGPLSQPPLHKPKPIQPLTITQSTTLTCDVVIVGSGAGGGVVAGELAEAGFDVIVVEKGKYGAERDFTQREAEMISAYYEAGGAYSTKDGSVSIFAGSCLGGGTTINWTAALRTPEYVLEEWAKDHANPHFLTPEYKRSFEAIEQATHIDTLESQHNLQNQALERGAMALGYHTTTIPRNSHGCSAHNCQECGYCSLGCQNGTKMGVLKTYLERANGKGTRFLVETTVKNVLVREGKAVGVQAECQGHELVIKAQIVVLAAGSIHTPAILLRSGLRHPHIGKHLHLHPTVSVAGVYPQLMNAWQGNMMTALSNEITHITGNWGAKLETPPIHSGLLAMALPWLSGKAHKEGMLKAAQVGAFIVLTRDRDGGTITLDKHGNPVAHYHISSFDLAHLQRGIQEAARIHQQAGAEELYFPHNHQAPLNLKSGIQALETALREIPFWRWKPNDFPLFSAHQMGTCRMGGHRTTHPVSPEGELYEVKNLFVADSSPFPEASGANPMLSIQAMAHFTAQGLKARYSTV